jgi:hypothetical protein
VLDNKQVRKLRVHITVLACAASLVPANAAEKRRFDDPTFLQEAKTDISRMSLPELKAFAQHMAECQSEDDPDPILRHRCDVSKDMYRMEFGEDGPSERAIDKWIFARFRASTEGRLHPKKTTTEEMAEEAIRYGKAIASIESAVRERFRRLETP